MGAPANTHMSGLTLRGEDDIASPGLYCVYSRSVRSLQDETRALRSRACRRADALVAAKAACERAASSRSARNHEEGHGEEILGTGQACVNIGSTDDRYRHALPASTQFLCLFQAQGLSLDLREIDDLVNAGENGARLTNKEAEALDEDEREASTPGHHILSAPLPAAQLLNCSTAQLLNCSTAQLLNCNRSARQRPVRPADSSLHQSRKSGQRRPPRKRSGAETPPAREHWTCAAPRPGR